MRNITKKIYSFMFLMSIFVSGYAQISIPYGNDGILVKDTSEIDFRFELHGNNWNCRYISYIFLNGTTDIAGNQEENAVRSAMDSWSAITNLDFIEACGENDADIRISWETNNHGDGFPFDGNGGVLAHGFFPPPNAGNLAGDIHFDDAENWNLNGDIDMETVALHELGHALGLLHSGVNNSVMEAVYEGERRNLTADDRNGIREIYGNRMNPIVGPSLFCSNAEFNLDDFDCLNENFNVIWEVSSNISILNGQGTGTIAVSSIGFGSSGFIRVRINSGCDELVFNKSVWVGRPQLPDLFVDIDACLNLVRIFDENYVRSNSSYEFMISVKCNGKKKFYKRSGYPMTLHIPFNERCEICIEYVIITNQCGSTFDDRIQCYPVPRCKGGEKYKIRAYPNPVSNLVSVEILDFVNTNPISFDKISGYFIIFNKEGELIGDFVAAGMLTSHELIRNISSNTNEIFIRYIAEDGFSNTEKLIIIQK